MDYYQILGVSSLAKAEDIKAAYRKKAALYHPDRNLGSDDTDLKFKEVKQAYEVLSDNERRQSYDKAQSSEILTDPLASAREIWESFLNPLCI